MTLGKLVMAVDVGMAGVVIGSTYEMVHALFPVQEGLLSITAGGLPEMPVHPHTYAV
jgi:hypothetical protein